MVELMSVIRNDNYQQYLFLYLGPICYSYDFERVTQVHTN